jgi:2-dehydro-3-deoxy-D-gluconate 5-dehydrogenase
LAVLDRFRLFQNTALVTGASKGLGAAIALALAEAGADVICHGNTSNARETAEAIQRVGRKSFVLAADLSQPGQAEQLFEHASGLAVVNIVVNNAGTIRRAKASEYGDSDWATVVEVNLNSVWKLSQCAGRAWIKRGQPGKIINIASLLAFQGGVTVPAYSASKGAVVQLTKALANEWATHGINVNAIAPGYVRTDNTLALQRDPVRNRQILERIPAGRWANPDDLSGAAVFLASSASDYVHGHVLVVDGGWMAR